MSFKDEKWIRGNILVLSALLLTDTLGKLNCVNIPKTLQKILHF